jgi:hypothetical protein
LPDSIACFDVQPDGTPGPIATRLKSLEWTSFSLGGAWFSARKKKQDWTDLDGATYM